MAPITTISGSAMKKAMVDLRRISLCRLDGLVLTVNGP